MAVLIATEVCKTFGSGLAAVHAIKDVSLRVDEGQLVLLMGPSGSGKTTLLLMCGSLLRPDRGRIFLNEKDISQASDSQLSSLRLTLIGFIFQQFNLLGGLTAIQNVELILNLNGIRGREASQRAGLALKLAGLRDRENHLPRELSVGEKQRVAIARALVCGPRLLIADEPTANLDSKLGYEIVTLIKDRVKAESIGALVASHDSRIQDLADVTYRLGDGRLMS